MKIWQNLSLNNLEGEEWLPIIGYELYYMVSNLGRIKSLERKCFNGVGYFIKPPRIMRQHYDKNKYLTVTLHNAKGEKTPKKSHRLVALMWIPNPLNKETVNHKFGDKEDNRAISLEWNTDAENKSHAKETGLMKNNGRNLLKEVEKQKKPILQFDINKVFLNEYPSFNSAPMSKFAIWAQMTGKTKNPRKYLWRYKKQNESYKYDT